MYDALTAQKLAADNQMYNSELKSRLDAMMSRDRVLDKAPDKYVSVCRGMEFNPFGVYTLFRNTFESMKQGRPESGFTLMIDNEAVPCDKETYLLLRTLMDVGVSKSLARAHACRELFGAVISRRTPTGITVEMAAKALRYGSDYYKNEIVRAAMDCLFTPREQVVLKLKDLTGDDYVENLVNILGEPADVDELDSAIKSAYKKVCMNPEFKVKKSLGRAVNVARYIKEGYSL